jgi:hypothetical protein
MQACTTLRTPCHLIDGTVSAQVIGGRCRRTPAFDIRYVEA